MSVNLDAAVAYQALKAFFLILGATTCLLALGLGVSGKLSRWSLPMLLMPGVVSASIVCLLMTDTYENKGPWATLHDGWVRPESGGIMDMTDSRLQDQARRAHRTTIWVASFMIGAALVALYARSYLRKSVPHGGEGDHSGSGSGRESIF